MKMRLGSGRLSRMATTLRSASPSQRTLDYMVWIINSLLVLYIMPLCVCVCVCVCVVCVCVCTCVFVCVCVCE